MTDPSGLRDLLRNVHCFKELEDAALGEVERLVRPVRHAKGGRICTEGDPSDCLFIVDSGEVAVSRLASAGESVDLAVLRRGDIAGELGLFGSTVRTATLEARTDCQLWVLPYGEFQGFVDARPEVSRGLLSYLGAQLVRSTATVMQLSGRELDRRLHVAFFHATPFRNELYRQANRYGYALHFFTPRLELETAALAAGARAVVVSANDTVDAPVVKVLAELGVEIVALRCTGFNNVDVAACERAGLSVARVPAYSPYAVAEHAVALMMTLNRHTHRANNRVREGNFSLDGLLGFDLHGRTVGIVGTGKIGACVASILHGFGCRLLAHARHPNAALVEKLGVLHVGLDQLFAEADVVTLHAPLTPETRYMVDAAAVARMKRGVMLINTSRGALVDTHALIEGLKSGQIGYAGLDVYEEEEAYFFEDHSNRVITDDVLARLTTFNNVLVTSHQGSYTDVAQQNIVDTVIANIREMELGRKGRELTNAVVPRG